MDFSWNSEQLNHHNRARDFGKSLATDDLVTRDREGIFSRALWDECANFGVQSLAMPSEYGGDDLDILSAIFALEGLGYGCRDNGLLLALNTQLWTVQQPLLQFGSSAQKEKFLPDLCAGRIIGAHALTEPDSGSDIYSLATEATKCDGGYRLNGCKRLITLAPLADLFLVFATTNPAAGKWGLTAFLVPAHQEGLERKNSQDKMGLRTVPIGELHFHNCFIPEDSRLGKEGAGFAITNHSLEFDRVGTIAAQVGSMERQLEETVTYTRERQQFGQSVNSFQSVSNRLADMKLRLETSRLLLYKTAWLKATNQSATLESSLLKLHLTESFLQSSLDAIRSRGGSGYLTETEVERDLRDSVGGVIYAGTSDIQRNIISKFIEN